MRRSIVSIAVLTAGVATNASAAGLKPRTLDVKVGAVANALTVQRNGTEVYVSWSDDASSDGYKGLIFDAATGRVLRPADSGGADGRGVENLGDGYTSRTGDTQDARLVLTEKIKNTTQPTDPIRVRDAIDGRLIAELLASERPIAAQRRQDGLSLLSGGQAILPGADKLSSTLRLWAPGSDKPRWSVDVPPTATGETEQEFVNVAATFSPDGRWVTAVRDKTVHLIDAATGTRRTLDIERGDGPIGVGFSPDGARLYVAGGNYQIAVYRTADLSVTTRIAVPNQFSVRGITEHGGGKVLELGGRRQTMFLDPATSQFVRHDRGGSISSYRLAWLGDGRILRASKSRRNPITYGVYKHENGKFRQLYRREWKGGSMGALTWSPNGRCILMSGGGKTMIMGPLTGGEVVPLNVKGDGLDTAAFARGGRVLIAADGAGKVLSYAMPAQCQSGN